MAAVATLLPNGEQTFVDENGVPYDGGKVYFYVPPATTTFKDTWRDRDHTTLNQNPVVLDSAGRGVIFGIGQYRQVLTTQFDVTVWDKQVEAMVAEADVTTIVNNALAAGTLYDLPIYIAGKPTAGEVYPIFNIVRNLTLPANLAGTVATIGTNPTGALALELQKNGTVIGTITFSTSGVPTIVFVSDVSWSSGDQFRLVSPSSQDSTGAFISITLVWTVVL